MRGALDFKCWVFGLAAVGAVGGCALDDELGRATQAEAGYLCAYVIGAAGGQAVTTPSIAIVVPDSGVTTDPLRVHVDETQQRILGYTVRSPGVDEAIAGQDLFVPGTGLLLPSLSQSLPLAGLSAQFCMAAGVSTPAVPIYIPVSTFEIPGVALDVPAITVTLLGRQQTLPGQILSLPGRTIVLPDAGATAPPVTVETLSRSVTVIFDGTSQPSAPLPPALLLEPRR